MRRVLIMLVALIALSLSGCGGGGENANTGTTNAGNANATRSETNSNANTSNTASLSSDDRSFMTEAATGGMAEVELGRLAAQKGQSADVKKFGQRMVDDHSKANDELKQLATRKDVTLPTDLTSEQKNEKDKLSKLSGAAFDKEYMSAMVEDHDKDVKAFQDKAKDAKDADLKAFVTKTLPTLEEHQKMAKDIKGKQ
ncbi:MAG TPA: DUF4142 domain-containing protein [Pyrinomonadaceae bacterium]|nr:DUF4142 domain-containing protein [Pyrinomonadaceae bacterium]